MKCTQYANSVRAVAIVSAMLFSRLAVNASPVETVALTLWGEARDQSFSAKHAIASTIWNRANGKANNLEKVCKARKQYSVWVRGRFSQPMPNMKLKVDRDAWRDCFVLASQMNDGSFMPSLTAKHYHEKTIRPYWSVDMQMLAMVGDHKFYK